VTREYSPEVKAAVMASLMEGQSIRGVSRSTGIPKTTIQHWNDELRNMVGRGPTVPSAKKEQIHELLVDLLIAKLESLIALSEHSGDKKWLQSQDASAVAMLLGVSDDKVMRMLEKFEDNGAESQATQS
jgi:transposase-like protein